MSADQKYVKPHLNSLRNGLNSPDMSNIPKGSIATAHDSYRPRKIGKSCSTSFQVLFKGLSQLLIKLRQLGFHDPPDDPLLDLEIVMYQSMAHADDTRPFELGVCIAKIFAQACSSFPNDLDVAHDRIYRLLLA